MAVINEAGDYEEHIDADEPARYGKPRMKGNDRQDGDRPEPLNVTALVGGTRISGDGLFRVRQRSWNTYPTMYCITASRLRDTTRRGFRY